MDKQFILKKSKLNVADMWLIPLDRDTYLLGPEAKFRCTVWLGAAWVAGRRRQAQDFAGKILE